MGMSWMAEREEGRSDGNDHSEGEEEKERSDRQSWISSVEADRTLPSDVACRSPTGRVDLTWGSVKRTSRWSGAEDDVQGEREGKALRYR